MKLGFSPSQPIHPSLLKDFLDWVARPTYRLHPGEGLSLRTKLWIVLRAWAASSLLIGLVAILIGLALSLAQSSDTEHSLTDLIMNGSPLLAFIFAVIVAPIQEELAFRLWLLPRRNTLAFGFSAFIWFFLVPVVSLFSPTIEHFITQYDILVVLALGWLITGVLCSFILKISRQLARIQVFFQQRFRLLIFASAIVFGLAHLINYPEVASIWYLGPILILPQFIIGYPLAYVRTKLGLFWSIVYHALHNGFLLIPILLTRVISIEGTSITSEPLDNLTHNELIMMGSAGLMYIWISIVGMILVTQLLVEYYHYRNS